MHILLIEASLSGHHSIYLERSVLAFLSVGHKVTISLPDDIQNTSTLFDNLQAHPEIHWVRHKHRFDLVGNGVRGLISRELNTHKVFKLIYKEVQQKLKIDYVFLPYLDYCLYAIGLLGSPFASTKFGGICMRPNFHHPVTGVVSEKGNLDAIKWKLFNRVLNNKNLGVLFAIDTLLVSISHRELPHVSSRIRYLADPVDDALGVNVEQVRAEFGATENTKTILVYGALDERKGLILLLDALENERFAEDWHVWLIGHQSNNIREMLGGARWAKLKQQQRVQVCDKFVTKEIEQNVLAACDVIWLAYRQHYGMSGVMVHAGRYKKATITCDVGLIGWYANKFKIGIPISPSCKSVIEALTTLSIPANRQAMASNGEECFKSNTWGNFAKILVSMN